MANQRSVITFDDTPVNAPVASKRQTITLDDGNNTPAPATPDIGGLEAAGRGAAQAFTLGYSPQVIAALKTGNFPGSSSPDYQAELAKQKQSTEEAWNQHPYLYGAGMLASALPAAASAVVAGPEEAAAGAGAGIASWLSDASNVASLGARAARGTAGASEGVLPSLARGAANVADSPIVQGGIYGASEGDTLGEKAQNAAIGAAGAKVVPAVLGMAGKAAKGAASGVVSPFFRMVTGSPTDAEIAAGAAHALNVPVPAGAVSTNPLIAAGAKTDIFNGVKNASAQTLGQLDEVVSNIHGNTLPVDAGNAVRDSFINDWMRGEGPNSLPTLLDNIYKPVDSLSGSTSRHSIDAIQDAIQTIKSSPSYAVSNRIDPTLAVLNKALSLSDQEGGLTFAEMRALRQEISESINFNKIPGSDNLDESILKQIRAATTEDMSNAAKNIGGVPMQNALNNADTQASKLYNLSEVIAKRLGGQNPNAAGAQPGTTIFNNLASLASRAKGDPAALQQIQQTISPEAWKTFSNALLAKQIPSGEAGQFTFKNFFKGYNSLSQPAKDIVFGSAGSGGARDTLENIATLGQKAGGKLDLYGQQATNQSPFSTGQIAGVGIEAALSGMPVRSLGLIAGSTGLGALGARDVAAALPAPTERAKFIQYLQNNPQAQSFLNQIKRTVIDPTLNATSAGQQIVSNTLQKASGALGAQAGIQLSPAALRAMLYGGAIAHNLAYGTGHASGGAVARASGGRVGDHHERLVSRLMTLAERAKKDVNSTTEPLLNVPDATIVKALHVANQAI